MEVRMISRGVEISIAGGVAETGDGGSPTKGFIRYRLLRSGTSATRCALGCSFSVLIPGVTPGLHIRRRRWYLRALSSGSPSYRFHATGRSILFTVRQLSPWPRSATTATLFSGFEVDRALVYLIRTFWY